MLLDKVQGFWVSLWGFGITLIFHTKCVLFICFALVLSMPPILPKASSFSILYSEVRPIMITAKCILADQIAEACGRAGAVAGF